MKPVVMLLNTLAVAAAAAFVALGAAYAPPGKWGLSEAFILAILLIPCIAAIAASRKRASNLSKSLAVWSACAWAVALTLLGLGASTGIGGAVGLLILIVPALLLLMLNVFVFSRGGRP